MKKLLISLLLVLLIVLIYFTIFSGISFGEFSILGYQGIQTINEELETSIAQATRLTSVTYPERLNTLQSTAKDLTRKKEEYEDRVSYSSEEDVKKANQFLEYETEFLWTRLGNYASKHGIKLKLDINPGATNEVSDLHFTLTGKYIPISDFVRDIEDDGELGFRIQGFKVNPGESNSVLQSEFDVKGLWVNVDTNIVSSSVPTVSSQSPDTNSTTNNTTTNNTTTNNTEANNEVATNTTQ